MGLGMLLTRKGSAPAEQQRTITEFAIIDGVAVDGSGEFASRYRGGMSIPGAWRAATLLSDLLGSVPWHAFRSFAGRPVEMLDPTPLLLEQPNPPETRMTTFSSLALDLLWHGNAIAVVAARNAQGYPTAALAVPADQVGVRRITTAAYSPLPVGAIEYSVGSLRLSTDDVIHIKGPCAPGALRGMGVLEAHVDTLNLAREQNRQARSLSQHGVPTGLLKSTADTTTQAHMVAAKAAWLEAQRDRTIAALGPGTDFVPLSWNPEELQLVDARKFTLTELELIFGLPVGWLGGQQSSRVYSNIEQDAVNLLKFSLRGHLARFEQALSVQMPRGTFVRANLDEILRADTKTRYEAHGIALDKGFLLPNEVRALEGRPPIAGLDEAWLARLPQLPALQVSATIGAPQDAIEGTVS